MVSLPRRRSRSAPPSRRHRRRKPCTSPGTAATGGDAFKACVADPFTKATGVTVVPEVGTSTVTLAKLQQQKDAPTIDVAWMDGGVERTRRRRGRARADHASGRAEPRQHGAAGGLQGRWRHLCGRHGLLLARPDLQHAGDQGAAGLLERPVEAGICRCGDDPLAGQFLRRAVPVLPAQDLERAGRRLRPGLRQDQGARSRRCSSIPRARPPMPTRAARR